MSLNRPEQMLHDYLQAQPDERNHWQERVRAEARHAGDVHAAAVTLERELWRYYEERAAVAEPFLSTARREGVRRTSLRNLAELLLRRWAADAIRPRDPSAPPALPYA
ncbi:MAG: hypothetical protein EAZ36_01045 [Verrucomicrobia bacterium]|nr:MAG: hypothetical protein EAZ36_01045 [Verrucomicrobiota bacterium]